MESSDHDDDLRNAINDALDGISNAGAEKQAYDAVYRVLQERRHQLGKGRDADHDDGHLNEVEKCAAYLLLGCYQHDVQHLLQNAPHWIEDLVTDVHFGGESESTRALVIAGALILADLEVRLSYNDPDRPFTPQTSPPENDDLLDATNP